MRQGIGIVSAILLLGVPAIAHHSIAGVYDSSQPVTVEGPITSFHFVNPHPYLEIDVLITPGVFKSWRLEMDNLRELSAVGVKADTFKAGERVLVTGNRARDNSSRLYVRSLWRPSDGLKYEQVGASPRVQIPGKR